MEARLKEESLSIIVPVLHEGERINILIRHLRKLAGAESAEIIVVDGDTTGSTIKRVEDSKARCILASRGRAIQMNRGAANASGDILLFLHADTFLPENAISRVKEVMSTYKVVGGAFALGFDSDRMAMRIIRYWAQLRNRILRIPFGDQAIFIRRKYFNDIGKYQEIPLMEDVELMARIKKRGDRIAMLPERVATSARKWEEEGILRSIVKNWSIQVLYFFGMSPEKLYYIYYGSDTIGE